MSDEIPEHIQKRLIYCAVCAPNGWHLLDQDEVVRKFFRDKETAECPVGAPLDWSKVTLCEQHSDYVGYGRPCSLCAHEERLARLEAVAVAAREWARWADPAEVPYDVNEALARLDELEHGLKSNPKGLK